MIDYRTLVLVLIRYFVRLWECRYLHLIDYVNVKVLGIE